MFCGKIGIGWFDRKHRSPVLFLRAALTRRGRGLEQGRRLLEVPGDFASDVRLEALTNDVSYAVILS